MGITKEKKEEYLDSGGMFCPYCDSTSVHAVGGVDVEGNVGTQLVKCNDCTRMWNDIYKLINIVL